MDLIFFGSGEFGLPTLAALAAHHRVLGVVTQPDRPAGRGGKTTPTPVGAWAAENLPQAPLLKPERIGDPDAIAGLRSTARWGAKQGALVVIAYGQKLPRALLADLLAINLHASLLPRWRGAAPINAAILAGDTVTGNSVITLADRMDAGFVLGQSRRPIAVDATAGELHDQLAADGPSLIQQVLRDFQNGTLRQVIQDESLATRAPKLSRADGSVDFGNDASGVRSRINGLSPWPGVTVQFRGEPLRLLRATASAGGHEAGKRPPGAILDSRAGEIACGDGAAVRLLEVQAPGKRAIPWKEFANGRGVKSDEMLVGGQARC